MTKFLILLKIYWEKLLTMNEFGDVYLNFPFV